MRKLFYGISFGLIALLILFIAILLNCEGWKGGATLNSVFEITILIVSVIVASYALIFSAYVSRLDTMIIILREQINAENLIRYEKKLPLDTIFNTEQINTISDEENLTIYDAFYNYYVRNKDDNSQMELTKGQIISIWRTFLDNSGCKDSVNAIFKQMYYCIHTVTDAPVLSSIKKDHIATIQSSLSSKVLFCYLMNQICFDQNIDKNDHARNLKKFKFFKRLIISDEFEKVKASIPAEIIDKFYAVS